VRVDRQPPRPPISMDNPALTMALTVQPGVIQSLGGERSFWVCPDSVDILLMPWG
jgi:hypothetical protein